MQRRKLILTGLIAVVFICNLSVSMAQNARPGDDLKGQLLYEENFSTSKGSLWGDLPMIIGPIISIMEDTI
jgi:hypothetical protein